MLALALRAGPHRFALPARSVLRVLPRCALREAVLAPLAVCGLLPFEGDLVPVVDLCQLTLGRPASSRRSTRIVLLTIADGESARRFGLLAEAVLDLLDIEQLVPGLRLPAQPWLGDHLDASLDAPQLLDPDRLLPDELAALFQRGAAAELAP